MIRLSIAGVKEEIPAAFELQQDGSDIDLVVNGRVVAWFEILNGKIRMYRTCGQNPDMFHVDESKRIYV